jgi:RNA polymerase sigma-70 factor (ECF subfamily)
MRFLRHRQSNLLTEPGSDPDGMLVEWTRQDPQAFTALYDHYFNAVYGYCLSQLGDPETAEDASSQTFLKALAALPHYNETGRFRPWLFAIAHNAVLDAIRGRRSDDPLEAATGAIDPAATPEEQALVALDQVWLDEVIALLPVDDQRVLELRRAGLTGPEIAQVLGISHEAAKKRQLRAMNRIRVEIVKIPGYQGVLRGAR